MRQFKVLVTCTNIHTISILESLKNNGETDVEIIAVNSNEMELPSKDVCDKCFVAPSANDPSYIPFLTNLCKEHKIDIVLPISNVDLELLIENEEKFNEVGTLVSGSPIDSLRIANNKISLHNRFGYLMPRQIVTNSYADVEHFLESGVRMICCKCSNLCGGKGFAVVDDERSYDPALFHRYGTKHYISHSHLKECLKRLSEPVIVQEYKDGLDYTVCCLCYKGQVSHMVGFVGYALEFGATMDGEIKPNDKAYAIAEMVVRELCLDGNIAFDFILDKDGNPTLLEVNPRINASLGFVAKAGVNMAYLRCKKMLGYDISKEGRNLQVGLKMKKYFGTRYYI